MVNIIPGYDDQIQRVLDNIDDVLNEWGRVKISRGLTQQIIEEGNRILEDAKNGVR